MGTTTTNLVYTATLPSPIGDLTLAVDACGALVAIAFPGQEDLARLVGHGAVIIPDRERTATVRARLDAYFDGALRDFDLPVAPRIGTPFQGRVWQALTRIPYGATWSYARLAAETGSVARAVGSANGANPIAIVVPCHRVIGTDGSLTGYAGGLERKRWLLTHEGAILA